MTLFRRMSLEPNHNDDVLQYDDEVEYESGDVEYERTNLFYKDDAELPEVETLYKPGDSRQEKTDKSCGCCTVLSGLQTADSEVVEFYPMQKCYYLLVVCG